ncbi:DgyrCDS5370 [Dimorphilus gyrociliatus]|uniref:Lipase maturation factor n=1 Tax=Dimorphilus gyrociliatus TaxID=2664684 RepID=A0A7I8VLC8_9ANNE|nr:DgyrCDS5370 [Dimorphilus gyrociliatus]
MASENIVRQRKKKEFKDEQDDKADELKDNALHNDNIKKTEGHLAGGYWLTRILLLRFLAFIQFTAFLVALNQNRALLGKNGLLPADSYLKRIKEHSKSTQTNHWSHAVTLLWLVDYETDIDYWLDLFAYAGLALSSFVFIIGGANVFIMLTIWILYHSIVNIGQRWIMIGAGLIKIRGDQCWRDLTCMNYHYQTQPVPNPIAYYMHQEPEIMHKAETMVNHFVELVVPFMLFLNRRLVIVGGFFQILFQLLIIISGNLSFLNWLTIIPSLACFDDTSISWMFTTSSKNKAKELEIKRRVDKQQSWFSIVRKLFNFSVGGLILFLSIPIVSNLISENQIMNTSFDPLQIVNTYGAFGRQCLTDKSTITVRTVWNLCFGGLIAYLSLPVVKNLLSSRQAMNTSFDSLRLVNTYGAFGSITKERTEVVFEGTYDDPTLPNAKWLEYEFNCKPGDVKRKPCLISPYHYRLDWLMWFAAFQNYQYNNWLVHLAGKFLVNDELTMSLIAHNPFDKKPPPKFVRALHYRYTFTPIGSEDYKLGKWWNRKRIGEYLPIINLDSIRPYLRSQGWHIPKQH